MKEEFDLVDKPFTNRGQRVDEMLAVIRSLLRGEMEAFKGEHFAYPPVQMSPVPSKPIPIRIGGNTEAALRRAARNDGWLGIFIDPDELGPYLQRLNRYRAELEISSREHELLIYPRSDPTPDIYRQFKKFGVTAAVNPPWYFKLGRHTTLNEKKKDMDQFAKEFILPLAD
jgi:alkanesulfonate monooxygenase SsuD/methylene tetrahydromethanopterin reductase-like flavin-dependent oxidoreductase (luciferase family)